MASAPREEDATYFGQTAESDEVLERRKSEERRRKAELAAEQRQSAEEEKKRQSLMRLNDVREQMETLAKIKKDLMRDRAFCHQRNHGKTGGIR